MNARMRRAALALAIALAAPTSAGCGGGLATAKSDYRKGRIAEAKEQLVLLEDQSHGWSTARRAEYALYRGLAHHSLGDRAMAALWLNEAKALEDTHPRTLSEDDRVRLKLALESLAGASAPSSP